MLGNNEGNTTYTHNKTLSDASSMSVNVSDRPTSNGSIKQKVGALTLLNIIYLEPPYDGKFLAIVVSMKN